MDLLSFFRGQSLSPPPSDDFWYSNPNNRTAAGVSVDDRLAMTYSACWAATMLLSSSEGMLPLKFFRKLRTGGSEVADNHPAYRLVYSNPNPEMTSMPFRASRTDQQVNNGNGFAEIERNRAGVPINLWPIHQSRIPKKNVVRKDGKLWYLVDNDDGSKTPIPSDDMLHIKSPMSADGTYGMGVIEHARLAIGLAIATETHGASYFGSGATPKTVITGAGKFKSKEDREDFRRQWNEMHGGPENANKPAILPEGMDIKPLNFSAEDAQFLETRQFSIEDIARFYGVPPHLIGHLLRATYSNIEHLSLEFVKYSLMRWLVMWEQEVNRKLLTEEEQKTMYCRHNVDALERGDLASRTQAFQLEVFNGKKTLNEWRAMDEENPIGPLGDVHWVQSAMVPLEVAAKGPQEPEPAPQQSQQPEESPPEPEESDSEDDLQPVVTPEHLETTVQLVAAGIREEFGGKISELEAKKELLQSQVVALQEQTLAAQRQLASAMLRDAATRLLSAEIHKVKHIAEKPSGFTARLHEFYIKHTAALERSLHDPLAALLLVSADIRDPAELAKQIAERHTAESMRQLDSLLDCQADELAGKVDECVSKWHEERTTITI